MSRRRQGERVIGIHAVRAALHARELEVLWLAPGNPRLQALAQEAQQAGIPVHQTTREELDRLAPGQRHQGVVAQLRAGPRGETDVPPERVLEQVLEEVREQTGEPPLLLVLDGVQDPHNLGACLRSAAAAGAHAVVAPKDRAAGLTPAARKVACGAAERLPFIQVTNLARTLRRLKAAGLWVAGADAAAPQSLFEADLGGPLALVLGGEGKGLRRLTRECCDLLVGIPMAGGMESLNVSVAAGICLFEVRRQRLQRGSNASPA